MLQRFIENLSDLICLVAAAFSCSAKLSINNSAYQFKRTNIVLPVSPLGFKYKGYLSSNQIFAVSWTGYTTKEVVRKMCSPNSSDI